ncbi:class I SAM-dependent DNA methyltransferase [Armatimonas sp.]|uniref:class I SAM-dependent DNA methyltransferase n=1 Tax=Armatimonas sp. TaxID=1872638 RepID=UPI0037538DFC
MDNQPDYDYYGLVAHTWDLHRASAESWSDGVLYRELAERYGQPVLDLGCATGRILLPYLERGIDTDGVDNSPELLEICRQKAVARGLSPHLYEQSIVTLDLPRRYKTILGSSSVFQLITDEAEALQTLKRIFAHLEPGGIFVTSFSFEWREGDALESDWHPHFEVTRPSDGATIRSFCREWHEPKKRLWHAEQRFEVEKKGEVVATEHHINSPEGRSYTQAQAIALFADAGFVEIRALHEFTHEPALPDDRLFCIVGEKPTCA